MRRRTPWRHDHSAGPGGAVNSRSPCHGGGQRIRPRERSSSIRASRHSRQLRRAIGAGTTPRVRARACRADSCAQAHSLAREATL
jgi:hypothetical protein